MITYENLSRRNGIRKFTRFQNPVFKSAAQIELPYGGIFHYIGEGQDDIGPSNKDRFIRPVTEQMFIEHVTELTSLKGRPKKEPVVLDPIRRQHYNANKNLRPLRNMKSAMQAPKTVLVVSYALLPRAYKYYPSLWVDYYRYENTWTTVWDTVIRYAEADPNRQQFIQIPLPDVLPTFTLLREAEAKGQAFPQAKLKEFSDPKRLVFLDVFKWIGQYRSSSLMNRLPDSALKNINLCWIEGGKWVFFNLGVFDKWREAVPAEIQAEIEAAEETAGASFGERDVADLKKALLAKAGSVNPFLLQKLFYSFAKELIELRMAAADGALVREILVEADKITEEADVEGTASPEAKGDRSSIEKKGVEKSNVRKVRSDTEAGPIESDDEELLDDDEDVRVSDFQDGDDYLESEEKIDELIRLQAEELEGIDEKVNDLAERVEAQAVEDKTTATEEPFSYEGPIDRMTLEMAEKGIISPAAYSRMRMLAERYRSIPDPTGRGETLEDLLTLPAEGIALPEVNPVAPDLDGVVDKSMLSNTKDVMEQRFIKDYYHRLIAQAGMAYQQAGIAVADYRITRKDDLMNTNETHVLKLVGPNGVPGTAAFTVPTLDKFGTYRSNGVRRRMRSQRGDVPIRKVSEREVGLSSYYGSKLFVNRSERAMFNYPKWLVTAVNMQSISDEPTVTDLRLGDVFLKTAKTPNVFSILAHSFAGFRCGDFTFDWNIQTVYGTYSDEERGRIESIEKTTLPGSVPCGRYGEDPLIMDDKYSRLYSIAKDTGSLVEHGSIEEIIGLTEEQREKQPIEIVELSISGKNIPIAVAIGALTNLQFVIDHFGINVNIYDRRGEERYRPGPNDLAVYLEDKVLVGDRNDRMTCFVLGSMLRFRNDFRRYPLRAFETPAGFIAIMERNQLGARYARELRLVRDMFIDPITRLQLKEMGEPTEILALFRRAAEMLLDDRYNEPTYFFEERDKGYERIAGFVYMEVVRSIRAFRSRGMLASAQPSMNPKAVWMNVLKDPATINVEESNPIANIKEKDVVVYSGIGGRSGRTMVAKNRTYGESDIGVTSEANVDNGNVGTIMYLTADPQYRDILGNRRPGKGVNDYAPSQYQSYPMMITPASDRDDRILSVPVVTLETNLS